MAPVVAEAPKVSEEGFVAALDEEELFVRLLAASFARSLRSAAVTNGARETDGPGLDEEATLEDADPELLLAADMNFSWSLSAEGGRTLVDGTFLKVCFGGTSSGGDGLRRPLLDSASLVALEGALLVWPMPDRASRGDGTGCFAAELVFGTGTTAEG